MKVTKVAFNDASTVDVDEPIEDLPNARFLRLTSPGDENGHGIEPEWYVPTMYGFELADDSVADVLEAAYHEFTGGVLKC